MMMDDYSNSEITMIAAPKKDTWFYIKLAFIFLFIAGDVYLNSKAEYGGLLQFDASKTTGHTNNDTNEWAQLSQLQVLIFGCTIVLQLSIASALFLLLCNTFPFQVGILSPFRVGVFKLFLYLQTIYMILSCTAGGMRLNQIIVSGNTDLWSSWLYAIVSSLHKLVAPCYYAASLKSAIALGHEKYYTKDAWLPPPTLSSDSPNKSTQTP